MVPLPGTTAPRSIELGRAIAAFLAAGDFAGSTIEVHRQTLEGLLDLGGDVALERVSRTRLEAHLRARYGTAAPATYNRNLATIASLFTWAVEAGHLAASPAAGRRRRKERRSRTQELQANAIPQAELQAMWRDSRQRLRDGAAIGVGTILLIVLLGPMVDLVSRQGRAFRLPATPVVPAPVVGSECD